MGLKRRTSALLPLAIIFVLGLQVAKGEIFTTQPEDQQIPLGYTADISFKCRAGDELTDPVYSWYKDNKLLEINGRYNLYTGELVISSPQSDDAGNYRCVITSSEGVASTNNAKLSFAYVEQSYVPKTLEDTVPQSAGVEMVCGYTSYSPEFSVFFSWENTNTLERIPPYGTPTHFISQKTGNMYLANPQPSDSGKYQCVVQSVWTLSNQRATASGNIFTLTVDPSEANYMPNLMVTPADTTYVQLNGRVFLECFASGNPTPTLKWSKDGSDELPRSAKISKSGQLYFDNAEEDAEGEYTCTATNNEGSVSASGRLVLKYPPRWNDEIESSSFDLGSPVSLSCSAKAVPAAEYEWWKNGDRVSQAANSSVVVQDQEGFSTLKIEDLQTSDSGIYQCVAKNEMGNAVSAANILVNSYPPNIDPELNSITYAGLYGSVTIDCQHTAAPAANVRWEKDGIELGPGEKYTFSKNASITIHDVAKEDEGEYTCTLTNLNGKDSSSGSLRAYQPTEITQYPEDVKTTDGESAFLECAATHDQALVMNWIWEHGDKLIDIFQNQYRVEGGKLTIPMTMSTESGKYTCCAETNVNTPCASANVYVTAPPNPPENVMVTDNSQTTQTLKWTAPFDNHSPIESYTIEVRSTYDEYWEKAETESPIANETSCVIVNLLPYNDYEYRVYATNELGIGSPSETSPAQKTTRGAPSGAPKQISGGGGNVGQLIVTWRQLSEKYFGSDNIEYEIAIQRIPEGEPTILILPLPDNSTKEDSDENWSMTTVGEGKSSHNFTVDSSEVWAPYNVKIRATNEIGQGPWSKIRIVHTFEIQPETAPVNVGKGKTSPKAYSADIQWDSLYSKNGHIAGYYVKVIPKAGPNIEEKEIQTVPAPLAHIADLSSNTVYEVKVAGFNSAGQGPWSEPFTFNTAKKPPGIAPKNVKVSIKNLMISADWDPIIYPNGVPLDEAPLAGYKIQFWWSNKTSAYAKTHTTTETKLDFTVANNSRYNIWVRGYSAGGDGVQSQIFAVSTESTLAPGYIQCCGAEAIKFNSFVIIAVTLLWLLKLIRQ